LEEKNERENQRLHNAQKMGSFTLNYLAQWQGLRGQDLDIDLSQEPELICSKTGMKVIYTRDVKKYGTEGTKG
jgi:hypothetical protein